MSESPEARCGRVAWPHEDYLDADEPCVCGLPEGHASLHRCGEGGECKAEWAGGRPPLGRDQ